MTANQRVLEVGLVLALAVCQQTVAQELQANNLLGRFRLIVEKTNRRGPDDAKTIPLTGVNRLMGGQKIVLARLESYIDQKKDDRKNAWAALYVLSPEIVELGHKGVYDDNGAPIHPEWDIPGNGEARILGVVFSHKKWSDNLAKKIKSAVNDPDYLHFITQLANFADLKAEQDTIQMAAARWEKSQEDEPLVALLDEFASRYQFDTSRLNKGDPAIFRLTQLMSAVTPALMSSDPRDTRPGSNLRRVARSVGNIAGSAASVGVPFAGLIKGLTTLAANVSVPFKNTYDIEPVLLQQDDPDNITLYSLSAPSKPHETVYLGALLTHVEKPQTVKIKANQHLPMGQDGVLHLERSIPQLKRARAWALVNVDTDRTHRQVTVSHLSLDTLQLNWEPQSGVKELPEPPGNGRYVLRAAWDWDSDQLETNEFRLHSLDSGDIRVQLEPEKQLIAGKGPVQVELEAEDFQFVERLELLKTPDEGWENAAIPLVSWKPPGGSSTRSLPSAAAGQLRFRLAHRDETSGKQPKLAFDLDTSALSPGFYLLRMTSPGKTTTDIDLTIYPDEPRIMDPPLRITGERGAAETLALKGTGLEWICGINSDQLSWKLHEDPTSCDLESWPSMGPVGVVSKRTAAVSLNEDSDSEVGDCLPFQLRLLSRTGPRNVSGGCVEVVGPPPSIEGHERLLPPGAELGLREDEVPAGVTVNFTIGAKNLGPSPSLELGCLPAEEPFQAALTLGAGQRHGTASLGLRGHEALFLSIDAGDLQVLNCSLTVRIRDGSRGLSNTHSLGKVIQLPRIESFVITRESPDEQQECSLENGDISLYEGILAGERLYQIVRVGWNEREGCPVVNTASPAPAGSQGQTLRIPVPWPPPEPHAPLFIWLHGEETGRATRACAIDESGCP